MIQTRIIKLLLPFLFSICSLDVWVQSLKINEIQYIKRNSRTSIVHYTVGSLELENVCFAIAGSYNYSAEIITLQRNLDNYLKNFPNGVSCSNFISSTILTIILTFFIKIKTGKASIKIIDV